jgi:hypothetical protein
MIVDEFLIAFESVRSCMCELDDLELDNFLTYLGKH